MNDGDEVLGATAGASFSAPRGWWRRLVEQLSEEQLEQLVAGELRWAGLGDDGVGVVQLHAPEWLIVELGRG